MPRDGTKNLIPTSERTKEQAREIARKGGVASGKARREKRDMKKKLELILASQVTDEKAIKKIQSVFDVETEEIDWGLMITVGMIQKASKGNPQAYEAIASILGETAGHRLEEQRLAFEKQKYKYQQKMELIKRKVAETDRLIKVAKLKELTKDESTDVVNEIIANQNQLMQMLTNPIERNEMSE